YIAVVLEDRAEIAARLGGFGVDEGVVSARVRGAGGAELGALAPRPGEAAFNVSVPVASREAEPAFPGEGAPPATADADAPGAAAPAAVGEVDATFSLAAARASLARIRRAVLLVTLLLFGVAAAAAALFAATIVRPLRKLEAATDRVARGDLSSEVEARGADEVAGLARSFNEMLRALERSREAVRAAAVELARREHLATLGQFTSVVAHELRNPLGIILSSAQVAANEGRTPAQRHEALGFIADEVRRLDRILTEFLRFARPRDPVRGPVDLAALCADAAARFDAPDGVIVNAPVPAAVPAPALVTAIAGQTSPPAPRAAAPATTDADADLVHQALLNLARNAAEAGARRITLRAGDGYVEVEDDGPGFPPDAAARAGEPFFTTKVNGSGLGLAVVKKIALAHGGRLEIQPAAAGARRPGVRIRVYLSAPAAAPAGAADPRSPHGR
ncbi:MAG TPA: HAMP domain-containing sensor histidine kinase, partial [Myxococcota bacterium]|nr:HAMP domain-containing sensor histidine kinase [Myxococcota bacterium]